MAVTRAQKETIIARLKKLFAESKLTLVADYKGMSVAQFQTLRAQTDTAEVTVKVVKNRLVRQALDELKLGQEMPPLQGMLAYVFSFQDEVKGAQSLRTFIKSTKAPIEFVGAIASDGEWMEKATVVKLSALANKQALLAGTIAQLQSPLSRLQNSLQGGLPALIANLQASKA